MFAVENGGLLTTVQDLGRSGYQKYGLAAAGATDRYAHRLANILVCNDEDAATLEITMMGLRLVALETTVIAITGANLNPYLNGKLAPLWTSFIINKGDKLHFKGNHVGCRAYLAVAGGIEVNPILGSRATDLMSHIGGYHGRPLQKGDIIQTGQINNSTVRRFGRRVPSYLIPTYENKTSVRVVLGPQDEAFTDEGINTLFTTTYRVTQDSNQMACRLEGKEINHVAGADISSEGMFPGAIQVPKNGLPIVFQSGRPSVGGYTKIGGVISVDQQKVAQLRPGDYIRFEKTTLEKAHQLYCKERKLFNLLNISY